MPLDPQAQQVLEQMAALNLPPTYTVSPEEARALNKARPRAAGPEVAKVEDATIPGAGPDIPVRIYIPSGPGPFPILAWFHGGGWVVGDLDTARLQDAGVPTTCTRYDGMIHGFFGMSAVLDKGQQAIADASAALRQAFAGS